MPSAGPGAGTPAAWRAAADDAVEVVLVALFVAAASPVCAAPVVAPVDGLLDRQLSVSDVTAFCDTCTTPNIVLLGSVQCEC